MDSDFANLEMYKLNLLNGIQKKKIIKIETTIRNLLFNLIGTQYVVVI